MERLLRDGRVLRAVLGTSRAEIEALILQLEEVWQQQLARRIGCLTRSKRGSRHDKRLADARRVIQGLPDTVSVIADSAFQGSQHPQLCLPRKGSKKHLLSTADRGWNRLAAWASVRPRL